MGKILDNELKVDDLKKMDSIKLHKLAEEIRQFLIQTISETGGHLASNLGVVELTIALHKVFNSPKDKIIWDVGHQAYVHKILTGRKNKMCTIRQLNGLSGFPKRKESIHDVFEVGHSSTSISAGVGMALARDIKNESGQVISIIGDGAMTAGMAYEALNQLGALKTNMIVILNDNNMSIDKNVGGMASHFNRLRTAPEYRKLKKKVKTEFKSFPNILKTLNNFKTRVKYFFVPGVIFEEMGLKYIGPVDGHNIEEMIEVLERANEFEKPVLVHAVTKKGKGYLPAEIAPENYHGVGKFDIQTGKPLVQKKCLDYSAVLGNELVKLAKENDKIVAITAAMPKGTGLNNFKNNFSDRFFDVGIAEQHGVTLAAGMAANGIKPYFVVYSSFLQRGYDQVVHDVCIQELPVVFAIDRAGLVGNDGETHHGVFDLSYLTHIPNMTVMSPKNYSEFVEMIKFTEHYNKPIALRYPRGNCEDYDYNIENSPILLGKAELLNRGKCIAIMAIGDFVETAYKLSQKFKLENINITIINMRFVKPIDEELILKISNTHNLIMTIENNVISGGLASGVNNILANNNYKGILINKGIPDVFIEHGSADELKKICGLDFDSLYKELKNKIDAL